MSSYRVVAATLLVAAAGLLGLSVRHSGGVSEPTPILPAKNLRGMWVWTTEEILNNEDEYSRFIKEISDLKINQVYLYVTASQVELFTPGLRVLIFDLYSHGISSYAMDGWRGYFDDASGPADLYKDVDNIIAYNSKVGPSERFVGFMTDLEPQDRQGVGKDPFHNDVAESRLTPDQRSDRDSLMHNWLVIHDTIKSRVRAAGMRLAASLPFWTDNYNGEPISATYNGITGDVTHFLMSIVDDYCVMSYSTEPQGVIDRMDSKLAYADSLKSHPRVFGGLETHAGAGVRVSYADTPGKGNRDSVIGDMDRISQVLDSHPSFSGINIHDWVGWRDLGP